MAFVYPIRPCTFGPRSSPLFAMPYLAVGGVGPWAWVGVAGRWARRHAAPAVVGAFIFFPRLGLFWRFGRLGFCRTRRTTTDETGLPPDPHSKNRKSPKFYRQIFFWRFKRGFHSSTLYFTLHFSAHSLAFWEHAFCYRVMDHGAPPPLGSPVAVIVILG